MQTGSQPCTNENWCNTNGVAGLRARLIISQRYGDGTGTRAGLELNPLYDLPSENSSRSEE